MGESWNRPKASMPMAECVVESLVEHVNANVDETLNSVTVPSHLLLLRHAMISLTADSANPVDIRNPA
jgi:hypothetical protein